MSEIANNYCLPPELYTKAAELLRTSSNYTGLAYINGDLKKRFDQVFGPLLFTGAFPIIAIAILIVFASDRHKPLVKVSVHNPITGKTESQLKIRTMIPDAHKFEHSVAGALTISETKRHQLSDPRITKSGLFLRRWSIDELPQLIHAGHGNYSLVGRRQLSTTDWENEIKPRREEQPYLGYISAIENGLKRGCTGLYQILGRSNLTLREHCGLEWFYSNNANFRGDFRILGHTVFAVLSHKGAI